MRVDIYRRAEAQGRFSYLVVPENKVLPQEVTNLDWERHAQGKDLNEEAKRWPELGIEQPGQQLRDKGYAITSLDEQRPG
ncbi:hypothetical protein GCM10022279_05490 [Comamonas faecalis]|uniref:YcgL domain-containing protein n=1 Tax=Comamonas faecalis TaxID=1387849 RepID=A0ABP7QMT9_9BURK